MTKKVDYERAGAYAIMAARREQKRTVAAGKIKKAVRKAEKQNLLKEVMQCV
jgi:hypothetical protein